MLAPVDGDPAPDTPRHREAASVQSLPVGHVSAVHLPPDRPSTARSPDAYPHPDPLHTPSSSVTVGPPTRRPAIEVNSRALLRPNVNPWSSHCALTTVSLAFSRISFIVVTPSLRPAFIPLPKSHHRHLPHPNPSQARGHPLRPPPAR